MTELPFPAGSRLVAYLRDSGGDDQDLSIPQQLSHIQAWCADHGFILAQAYTDEARTGSTTIGRTAFFDMLRHFQTPNCQETGIILWSYARFSRDIDDSQYFKADLRRQGYEIYSITDPIPAGLDGRFFEAAIDWANNRRLVELRKEVKRGLHYIADQHGALGGTPPTGFIRQELDLGSRRDGTRHIVHRWVPDPDLIPLIQKAWHMRAAGASYKHINQETRLFGSKNSYSTFFRNKLYIGILEFGGKTLENYCDPIIDLQAWNKVQQMNRTNRQSPLAGTDNPAHPRRTGQNFVLSGLAYCNECGAPLNGHVISSRKSKKTYTYYACSNAKRNAGCTVKMIPQQLLEQCVLDTLIEYILIPENLASIHQRILELQTAAPDQYRAVHAQLTQEIAALDHKIANLVNAIAEKGHTSAMLAALSKMEDRRTEISLQLQTLQRIIDHPPALDPAIDINKMSAKLIYLIKHAAPDELHAIYASLIAKVLAVGSKDILRGEIVYYDPYAYDQCPHGDATHRHKFSHPLVFPPETSQFLATSPLLLERPGLAHRAFPLPHPISTFSFLQSSIFRRLSCTSSAISSARSLASITCPA